MLSPLSESEYTANNNFEFINYVKIIFISLDHKLMLFDLNLLFTNVPLDFPIDFQILKRIYKDNELKANIKKKETKRLPLLCTK